MTFVDAEDARQLLEGVGQFARERIAPLCARPESPMTPEQVAELTQQAGALGIIPQSTTEPGYGIWENSAQAQAVGFSSGALRVLALACPGLAFAWHRFALARLVAAETGLRLAASELQGSVLLPTGHYGLSRTSLGAWLKGAAWCAEDRALLADWLDRGAHPVTLSAPRDWSGIVWPLWRGDRIAWAHVARSQLAVRELEQHGLDELGGFSLSQPVPSASCAEMDEHKSRLLYQRVLKLDMLGLLAIGAGALDRGQALALDYAAIRRQGGKAIIGHAAVQIMLADMEMAQQLTGMALATFTKPVDELDLGMLAATRASTSAALCHAANQVMQVHGGIGYMRDAGAEKLVRDQNMLKLMAGGVRDIHGFLAGWNGAH